jgi:hypothetical protein
VEVQSLQAQRQARVSLPLKVLTEVKEQQSVHMHNLRNYYDHLGTLTGCDFNIGQKEDLMLSTNVKISYIHYLHSTFSTRSSPSNKLQPLPYFRLLFT